MHRRSREGALIAAMALPCACGEIREVPVGGSTSSVATGGSDEGTSSGAASTSCGIDCDEHGDSRADESASTGASSSSGGTPGPEPICAVGRVAIPDAPARGAMATIEVPDFGAVVDVDVAVRIDHGFVGDLRVALAHERAAIVLVDQPGGGGCAGAGLEVVLDDESGVAIECSDGVPAVGGTATPDEALAAFDGGASAGPWTLTVTDLRPEVAGTLLTWCLDFAGPGSP